MGGITTEEALCLVLQHTPVIQEKEQIQIANISGRVLAEDVKTVFDNPPFHRSPIDGYACRAADFIIGPLGILSADSLLGEVTPAMAVAVGQSHAQKLLLPVNRCNNHIIGTADLSVSQLIDETIKFLKKSL